MNHQSYITYRNEKVKILSAGKNTNGRQKIQEFRNYVKDNIVSILETNKGLRREDFIFLKNYMEIDGKKETARLIDIFESNGIIISDENKKEIYQILNSSAIIDLDRKYLSGLLGIENVDKEKMVWLMKHKAVFDDIYSGLLTRQILISEFASIKSGDIDFYDKALTCSENLMGKSLEDIMKLVKKALKDKNPRSGQGMFFNALIPEESDFVLKAERMIEPGKKKDYQRRTVSHFKDVSECLGNEFLLDQIVFKPKNEDKIFVLQQKLDLSKMKLLKYIILEDAVIDFKKLVRDKENANVLKKFIEGLERLHSEKKLLLDTLGDNIFYEIKDGRLNIKIIDTGCFETKWDYKDSPEMQKSIAELEDLIEKIKEILPKD